MRYSRYPFAFALFAGFLVWYWLEKTAVPFLTLAAILLHEGGHCVGAALCGVSLRGVRLLPWEARLSLSAHTLSYPKECIICLAGPATNLLTVLYLHTLCVSPLGSGNLSFFSAVSLSLALLNLLPIDDFDGGRLCRCICSSLLGLRAAERVCELLSFLSLFCLWSASIYLLLRADANLSLFLFSATIFLRILLRRSGS